MNRNAANASFGAGMAFTAVLQQQTEVAKPLNPRVDQSLKVGTLGRGVVLSKRLSAAGATPKWADS